MNKNKRINIDFNSTRNRISHRTNEATLVVGRKSNDPNRSDTLVNSSSIDNSQLGKAPSQDDYISRQFGEQFSGSSCEKVLPDITEPQEENSTSQGIYNPVTLTVKFHETRTSAETVLVDPNIVPGAKPGDIGEIQCLFGSRKKFFFKFLSKDSLGPIQNNNAFDKILNKNDDGIDNYAGISGKKPSTTAADENENLVTENGNSNEVSGIISILSGPIVNKLELKPRSQVLVRVRNKDSVQADTVEIYVKDIHLSRGDMWNISSLMVDKCVYKNQKPAFINNSIRLSVNKIYKNGHKFFSSYVGKDTKLVFRSDSARLIVFIQISSEMWHFEESGQQLFHKLMNSFFPKAFQKWKDLDTHHLITIILFSSVDLEGDDIRYSEGETPPNKADYYRVVVDQVHILLWNEIMATLRVEFANFKRDIYLHRNKRRDAEHPQEYIIEGDILPSAKGSILEAINLGMSLVSDDFKDSYLRQTTNHFIMISPGTGLFDVSYDMLIRTSNLMSTIDSTVDIICLSQAPLHIVPLVRYLDNQNKLKHCIPNWLDISFWTDSSQAVHQWLPKCKIYELQMMGVMENELSNVNISGLEFPYHRSASEAMDSYDQSAFKSTVNLRQDKEPKRPKRITLSLNSPTQVKHKLSAPSIRDVNGLKPSELIVGNNKSSPATVEAFGVSTTSKPNVSAFSSLLSLSKSSDLKTSTSTALKFVRKIISTPILNPSSPDLLSRDSLSDLQSVTSLSLNENKLDYRLESIPLSGNKSFENVTDKDSLIPSLNRRSNTQNFTVESNNRKLQEKKTNHLSRTKSMAKRNRVQEGKDFTTSCYWTDIDNPSNSLSHQTLSLVSYGRWRFVFPPNVKRRAVKWISLSSPASLPIMTMVFPTLNDFNQNYTFRIYDVIPNQNASNEKKTSETLMRQMISLRLSLGYQICIGERVEKVESHRKPNGDSNMLVQYLSSTSFLGSRIYLSLGNEIHRISCDYNGLINVQVYKRVSSTDEQFTLKSNKEYIENIRTRYSETYSPVKISSNTGNLRNNYNWNQLDQVLAGYEDSIDKQKYHRMKFVILPASIPENTFTLKNEKLSAEEIRLEGIRTLIMNIYRIKYRTKEEKHSKKRLEIAPQIHFYTGNLFDYLKQKSLEVNKGSPTSKPQYNKNIDVHKLIEILQGPDGIQIMDRYWHLKFYKYCFLGMDLVNFLVENFEDIETREDAVEYGNKLMQEKIILHVISAHKFLDGHYFYYFDKKFLEGVSHESFDATNRKSIQSDKSVVSSHDQRKSKSDVVMLSEEVVCDLDSNGYSWQPELVKVHYDIVHNPEHCFHLRIEWLSTTSKLIEDMINGWSKYCERYGLSLVEIPWEELFTLPKRNPLHSTIEISLCLDPWKDEEFSKYGSIFKQEKYYFHLYLLTKSSFMLDNRTATYFKDNSMDVVYSWGKPMFKYAQFIHSTGGYIAELRNNGDFFLAPNNAHISRLNLNIGKLHNLGKSKAVYFDSQSVMLEFRSTCSDETKLREMFREAVIEFNNFENLLKL